jgi:plasmid stabilization system protein ParE
MSSYSVFLSPIAEKKLILLLEYLEIEWGVKSKKDYLKQLQKAIKTISKNPKAFEESKSFKNLYRCVVTKQSAFFYRINKKEIEIITIIDNRQNPEIIKKELRKLK